MADPPVEAGQPPPEQGKAPVNLSICFRQPPGAEEVYGTIEGVNSRRLLQAQQDETLQIFHRPPPENPRRPQSLYDVLPQSQRKLLSQAICIWDDKRKNRRQVSVIITDAPKYLLKVTTKRRLRDSLLNDHRAEFKIGTPDIDVRTLQFLQNAICTICESRKY